MGYVTHNAIIVTSFNRGVLVKARYKAKRIGLQCTSIVESNVNKYGSFLVSTDGSKSGWDESDNGDTRRAEFRAWLAEQRYEDHSSPLEWAEVEYGSDDGSARVVAHEWKRRKSA